MRDSREKGERMRDQDPPFQTLYQELYILILYTAINKTNYLLTVAYRISSRGFVICILMRTNLLFTDNFKQSITPVLMPSADDSQDKHLFRFF